MSAKNIAILVDEIALGSPEQQILDRFLIGFARDGIFEKRPFKTVIVWSPDAQDKVLQRRQRDFPITVVKSRNEAVAAADAVVFMQQEGLPEVIGAMRSRAPVFVYGL